MRHLFLVSLTISFLLSFLLITFLWVKPSFAVAFPAGQAAATAGTVLSQAEMSKQATQQSAAAHRIEALPDGRARVPSPLQAIEAAVAPEGITVVSTAKGELGTFTIHAASMGRSGDKMAPLPSGKVSVDGQLARITRPFLIEELTTSAAGVRQDFVVPVAPQGKGDLVLELDVLGVLVDKSGSAAKLTLESGRELLYHQLIVTDSTGKKLPARFEFFGAERLSIAVSDVGATYPVRIDPTITDADWVSIALPDTNGTVRAFLVVGTILYAAGDFTAIGGTQANSIAMWNGSSWSSLGSGMIGAVYALTWDGTNLYAGGNFTSAGGTSANLIAKWNGSSWSALGSGMNGSVLALAWNGTNLYAGGDFTTAGGAGANYIAKWNGSNWSALGSGMSGYVRALSWDGTTLYAGGWFTTAGGTSANYIAKWNGSSWSALGSGTNNGVWTLAWDGTNLYAGGEFTSAGGTNVNRIAKWDGSSWSVLGDGMNSIVYALAWDGTNLYAGGDFTTAGGVSANRIAKWDGSSWSALGSGMSNYVNALVWDGTNLYAGGNFTSAGGTSANLIAKWNGSSWSALGSGMNKNVNVLTWDGNNLYAGGDFTTAGGAMANYIAKWDGSSWSALGSGTNNRVWTLAWDGTNLYAGGDFTTAGESGANYIAKWDGSSWSALGSGTNNRVWTLAWDGTNLYAGGDFTTAGGTNTNRIAKWNGSSWSALGSGMDNTVRALAWDGTNLYAGGAFAIAHFIAKWDGSSWSALGSGMDNEVYALAWDGTNLYAGGAFKIVEKMTNANYIAKWNGSSWSALGSGMNNSVSALVWDGTNLHAGGKFTAAGGTSAKLIAMWDGSSWSALGNGMNSTVIALAWDGTNLYAGGAFTTAGGKAARVAYVKLSRTVTATAGANGSISSTNPMTVVFDATTSFTLAPDATYQPSTTVTGDCPTGSWNGNTYTTGTITANCSVGFTFTKIIYLLSLSSVGSGSITATASDYSDQTCSGSCGYSYDINTVVTLTASPGNGYTFTGWNGACSGTGGCVINMSQNRDVSATFTDATSPTVTQFSIPASGISLSVPITSLFASDNSGLITGYMVTDSSTQPSSTDSGWSSLPPNSFTVSATGNWTLYAWAKDAAGNVSLSLSATTSIIQSRQLTVTIQGGGTGAVHSTPIADINCTGGTCYGNYPETATLTLTALPNTGYIFTSWSGCTSTVGSNCVVGMGSDRIVTATFESQASVPLAPGTEVTVSPTAGVDLTFASAGAGTVTVQPSTATPPPNVLVIPGTSYEISISATHTDEITVCIAYDPANVTGSQDTLRIYHFTGGTWVDITRHVDTTNNTVCGATTTLSPFAIVQNTSSPESLSVTISGSGSVRSMPTTEVTCTSGTCNQSLINGSIITLVPKAASGYYFGSWTGCDSTAGNVCTLTMSTTKSVTANFIAYPSGSIAIAAGNSHTVAIKNDGTVWAWGSNNAGQVGDASGITQRLNPVQVPGLTNVISIAAADHTLALMSDGTVWSWGYNYYGQLGINTADSSSHPTPVQISGLSNITAIATGSNHSLALKSDGTVWAWGWNMYGQSGTTANNKLPAQVSGLSDIVAIAAGHGHSLALKRDGTVWAWGMNNYSQLGASGNDSSTPVQVPGLGGTVVAIAGGWYHSLALMANGTVKTWGRNDVGQLGNGTAGSSSPPVAVSNLTGVTSISGGSFHSLAILSGGTVRAWGRNFDGELGNNYGAGLTPVVVLNLDNATQITAGNAFSQALKDDGTIWGWGKGTFGLMADMNLSQHPEPVMANPLAPCNVLLNYTSCHTSISSAYDAAANNMVIQVMGMPFAESLNANKENSNITVKGGYADSNFQTRLATHSSVTGFTVTTGSIVADQLTIK